MIKTVFVFLSYSFIVQAQEAPKPNIILILSDDLGIGDISCYFGKYKTPNIDKIAAEGIRFTNYYSASPICSPSRAGIFTGQVAYFVEKTLTFLRENKGKPCYVNLWTDDVHARQYIGT
ncbi:hypothetical protein FAZ15_02875 [Sphingobacterium olei]|uniref:Sulfatase N-terminal domain-containing protein n=2 Tax=Sphingobacterium olei TaxID=2571155 RepID=A0A4U0P9P6_9SPHI|nr:hypothetical protein FAZ15_02875 [Sphingobacterium olei]